LAERSELPLIPTQRKFGETATRIDRSPVHRICFDVQSGISAAIDVQVKHEPTELRIARKRFKVEIKSRCPPSERGRREITSISSRSSFQTAKWSDVWERKQIHDLRVEVAGNKQIHFAGATIHA